MAMRVTESHRTPDGLFTLLVGHTDDGDVCLGFDGYPAHTHADILASLSGLPESAAIRRYVDALLAGKSVIGISRVGGQIRDVWVEDVPSEDKYKPPEETIEYRYWDGTPAI